MTLPIERTRALLWAGAFLIELAGDDHLPLAVRRRAVGIARHFPTVADVASMATLMALSGNVAELGASLALPSEVPDWAEGFPHGPLRHSTRLAWPEDEPDPRPAPTRPRRARKSRA